MNKKLNIEELNEMLSEQKGGIVKVGTLYDERVIQMTMENATCHVNEDKMMIEYDEQGTKATFVFDMGKIEEIVMSVIFGIAYYIITYPGVKHKHNYLELKVYNEKWKQKYIEKSVENKNNLANIFPTPRQ